MSIQIIDLKLKFRVEADPDTFGYKVYYWQSDDQLSEIYGHSQHNVNEAIADLWRKLVEESRKQETK